MSAGVICICILVAVIYNSCGSCSYKDLSHPFRNVAWLQIWRGVMVKFFVNHRLIIGIYGFQHLLSHSCMYVRIRVRGKDRPGMASLDPITSPVLPRWTDTRKVQWCMYVHVPQYTVPCGTQTLRYTVYSCTCTTHVRGPLGC
eukprot:jgi/Botrbrau1/10053/Bobra.0355s0009.1